MCEREMPFEVFDNLSDGEQKAYQRLYDKAYKAVQRAKAEYRRTGECKNVAYDVILHHLLYVDKCDWEKDVDHYVAYLQGKLHIKTLDVGDPLFERFPAVLEEDYPYFCSFFA